MSDSAQNPLLKLPQIRSSSNNTFHTDKPSNVKNDSNSYEEWRANIHRKLEEDLQRQVVELLDETEQQESFDRSRRLPPRVGQRLPFQQSEVDIPQGVPWSEIDRRNRNVLYPNNAKDTCESQDYFPTITYQKTKLELESDQLYYRRRRHFLQQNNEYILNNSSFHFQKLPDKRTFLTSTNHDSLFLYGNSIVKSTKAALLNLFDQQLPTNSNANIYVNKHGIRIGEDGPFWPCDFRILHPTPRLFTREIVPKEFYFTAINSSLTSK